MGKVSQQQILMVLYNKQPVWQTDGGYVWHSTITKRRYPIRAEDVLALQNAGHVRMTEELSLAITEAGKQAVELTHWTEQRRLREGAAGTGEQ